MSSRRTVPGSRIAHTVAMWESTSHRHLSLATFDSVHQRRAAAPTSAQCYEAAPPSLVADGSELLRLLSLLCLLPQDLLYLAMHGHVFVDASVDAGRLADGELWLLVHGDALSEALLGHPAVARRAWCGCGCECGVWLCGGILLVEVVCGVW